MKNLLLIISFILNVFLLYKYKIDLESYKFNFIDIESEEDQLEKRGLFKDNQGNILKKEEII